MVIRLDMHNETGLYCDGCQLFWSTAMSLLPPPGLRHKRRHPIPAEQAVIHRQPILPLPLLTALPVQIRPHPRRKHHPPRTSRHVPQRSRPHRGVHGVDNHPPLPLGACLEANDKERERTLAVVLEGTGRRRRRRTRGSLEQPDAVADEGCDRGVRARAVPRDAVEVDEGCEAKELGAVFEGGVGGGGGHIWVGGRGGRVCDAEDLDEVGEAILESLEGGEVGGAEVFGVGPVADDVDGLVDEVEALDGAAGEKDDLRPC